jgi:endonuclease/exonuclease/phosphatase family metal-dependent hydrolase
VPGKEPSLPPNAFEIKAIDFLVEIEFARQRPTGTTLSEERSDARPDPAIAVLRPGRNTVSVARMDSGLHARDGSDSKPIRAGCNGHFFTGAGIFDSAWEWFCALISALKPMSQLLDCLRTNLCLGLGAFLLLVQTTPGLAAPVTDLRVMSFNIWVNGGTSLTRCIDAIRTSGADIVGLQECNAVTARNIATNLGFYYLGVNDVSIVSRYPIVNTISTGGGSGVAIELSAGQIVYFFNCHLAAYPYGPYSIREGRDQAFVINQENQTRMPALNQLLGTMGPYLAGSSPCFLTGDFNAPSHLDYASYPWPTSKACEDAGLLDSYRTMHSTNRTYPGAFSYDEPGITWTPMISQEPNSAYDRIDFVLFSSGDGMTVVASTELDGRNSVTPWPSDHRAVVSRFTLVPPVLGNRASQPSPPAGATNVPQNVVLSWLPGSNTLSHQVYFGTTSPGIFRTNTTNATFVPGALAPGSNYYWRVDEVKPSGVVTGDVWSFTTAALRVYEWNFSDGDLAPAVGDGILSYADGAVTSNLTSFGTSDGATVPHMGGSPTRYMYVPAFVNAGNGYQVTFTGAGPNGGGVYINQFTVIFDLLIPAPLGRTPLFNTNPQNANDADFYIEANGRLGISAIGYSAPGVISSNAWHRIAFAADLAANTVTYYVNGNTVFTGTAALDGRHSLYSSLDAGPDLLLFNEGDTTGTYTHALYLSSFAFTDRTMSASEIQALGGPKDLGIFVQALPRVSILRNGGEFRFNWRGAPGIRLQKTPTLGPPDWQDVPGTLAADTYDEALGNGAAFYRLAR